MLPHMQMDALLLNGCPLNLGEDRARVQKNVLHIVANMDSSTEIPCHLGNLIRLLLPSKD